MVSKKRLDYGFNGYRVPVIPRAPRSIRRRNPHKKLVEDSKLYAFELLAAVAGKLLKESESSSSSNVAEEKVEHPISLLGNEKVRNVDDEAMKSESYGHGSCAESAFIPENSVQEHNLLFNFNGDPKMENDSILDESSSDFVKKLDCDIEVGICKEQPDSFEHKVGSGDQTLSEDDKNLGDLSMANISTIKEPIGDCVNTNVLINSESSVQPLYRDPIPDALLQKHWNNVKLGIRDDDENYFECKPFSTKVRPFRPQPRLGHRRIRKTFASKYWKSAPKLKDYELYNNGDGMKTFYKYRKSIYARERFQRAPFKKRKLSDHSFAVAHDQDVSSDSISNLPEMGTRSGESNSTMILHRAIGTSDAVKGCQKMKDPHVKFSIKSFRVPELYIEVPETATVGSLKRTVMEAVSAILEGEIRVGVVLQGKKVRDDGRTLQQAGISQSSPLDTLGFTLEPSFAHFSPTKSSKTRPLALPCDADQQLPRSPATPMLDSGISSASIEPPVVTKLDNDVGNNEVFSSPKASTDTMTDGAMVLDSKALVPISPSNMEALAAVPVNSKPKRAELSQRRTRRPFSVGEVEALVAAVETLGTGRWRDVKMRAFENADHRTYVDLKDKWKTLVHTASISPQQRRGEPVPQDLLNRVLSAHSYWSDHQLKQHAKHLVVVDPLKLGDGREGIVGA